ncbi:MAG: histidinol-phosphatase HisJ [Promethearchaeota archaeon]
MKLQDWHTHSALCRHATGTLEDYVKSGIQRGLETIAFNDHFPYEFYSGIENVPYQEYSMSLDEIDYYLSTARELKKKYEKRINIKIGFEIEFIDDQVNSLNLHLNKVKSEIDFIFGSVHVLNSRKGLWPMDDSRFVEVFEEIGIDEVYQLFYQHLRKMIQSKAFDFDIVSHFDLPKKFNKIPNDKEQFWEEVAKTLELIKHRNLTMEINTSGFRKDVKEQYPSTDIIKMMYKLEIPILLGSDAHAPEEVGWEFNKMILIIKDIGYNQLAHYSKRKRTFIEI